MNFSYRLGFAVALITFMLSAARAADFLSEDIRIPMVKAGPLGLEALLVRPAAEGKYPLALISHGTPAADERIRMSARDMYPIALEFARRGFASLVLMRRGYGTSPGSDVDSWGSCNRPAYLPAIAVAVADLRAAIDAMNSRPDVTMQGMIAVGHSAGGLATVALTSEPTMGLAAAINFAGGRGGAGNNIVCDEVGLVNAFGKLGRSSRVPMLWIYASNDHWFAPSLAHRFHDAFQAAGGNAKFVDAPPFGSDGHHLLSIAGTIVWRPVVDAFLGERNLGRRDLLAAPANPALAAPPQLGEKGREHFLLYVNWNLHKAFAVSPTGHFGWQVEARSTDDAQRSAMAACAKQASNCEIYAVDNERVQ